MATRELVSAYRFFRAHAGGIVGQNAQTALRLAKAEIAARNLGWSVTWEVDDDADLGDHEEWCAGARRDAAGYDSDGEPIGAHYGFWRRNTQCPGHFAEWAALRNERGESLESLSGILDADRDYRRVIAAEMALSALDGPIPASALYACMGA